MKEHYELWVFYDFKPYKEERLCTSPSKELLLQVAIDMYNRNRINHFWFKEISDDGLQHWKHLDFSDFGYKRRIDMKKYQKEHPERIGKIK